MELCTARCSDCGELMTGRGDGFPVHLPGCSRGSAAALARYVTAAVLRPEPIPTTRRKRTPKERGVRCPRCIALGRPCWPVARERGVTRSSP